MACGDFPIEGRIAVVTGGGSGINLSFVKLAVQNGAKGVIVADLRLVEDAQKFVDQNREKVAFSKCDVTKRKDLEDLVAVAVEKFGDVPDVYIAGAGVFEPAWSNWWDDTEDDGYAELDINVTHALKLGRIAMRSLLKAQKKGVFLIVASLAGYMGTFAAPLYCASKHAVIGFIRSMAPLDELEGIKMVAVAPGLVHTPLWTDRPNVMQNFGYQKDMAVTPDFVAERMMDMVVKGEYSGGSCLEVSASEVRTLGVWGIPPPKAIGTQIAPEALERSYAPLKAVMEKDKGNSSKV